SLRNSYMASSNALGVSGQWRNPWDGHDVLVAPDAVQLHICAVVRAAQLHTDGADEPPSSKRCGFVQTFATKSKRCLCKVMQSQGFLRHQPNPRIMLYQLFMKLYFPLNLSGWTTWKVGLKPTSTTFVRLSTLRGALESLRNGEQHLDFTCYAWTTHHFRHL